MLDLIHEAGWGAYPTMILGVAGLVLVARYRGTGRALHLAVAFAAAILASGALGTATGQASTHRAIQDTDLPAEQRVLMLSTGTKESQMNFLLAGGLAGLVLAAGATFARRDGAPPQS